MLTGRVFYQASKWCVDETPILGYMAHLRCYIDRIRLRLVFGILSVDLKSTPFSLIGEKLYLSSRVTMAIST